MTQSRIQVLPASVRADEWTKAKLIEHLKMGMQVELSTIPLYLYAYFSINADGPTMPEDTRVAGAKARFALLGVAQQEMLHLTLIGNILRAVDETPMALYDESFIPVYPNTILSSKVPMTLTRAGRESFENFINIEAPYYPAPPPTPPPPPPSTSAFVRSEVPDEPSIGDFYMNLVQGIEILSKTQDLFNTPRLNLQFGGDIFNRAIQINDKDTALQAIELVTEQGEGGVGIPESHYAVFMNLYNERHGWICYDVLTDPHRNKYPPGPVKELVLAFDATYCYLLLTIEQTWTISDIVHRRYLINNIHSIMMGVVTPLASLLVQQPIGQGQQNAGPCFEYYPTTTGPETPLVKLHQAIGTHLNAASTQNPNLKDPITLLLYTLNEVRPYSQRN